MVGESLTLGIIRLFLCVRTIVPIILQAKWNCTENGARRRDRNVWKRINERCACVGVRVSSVDARATTSRAPKTH